MKMWIAYDNSRAHLPYAWADSAAELARLLGVNDSTVRSCIHNKKKGACVDSKYACVELEDDDDELYRAGGRQRPYRRAFGGNTYK
jgi:hypothetical protein